MAVLLATLGLAAAARGDELRNVKVGQPVPPFGVTTVSGEKLQSSDLRGKVLVLVYLSAEQQSSERALKIADVVGRELRDQELVVAYMTADVTRVAFFRAQRDRLNIHRPLGLDVGRRVYGELGLIVLPTTIVVDGEGRLARVISSCKSDYEHVLRSYVRHTLGLIDDGELAEALSTTQILRNQPADRIARRRAAARLLREKGLVRDAENELRAALEIDAEHADTLLDLASLHIDTERFEEAGRVVEQVRTGDPEHRRGKLLYGIVLYHQGRLDEAEPLLEETLLLNPDPVRTHYYLGLIAERRGDQSAAIVHFKESLKRLLREHPR
jgi:peroxiredoxin